MSDISEGLGSAAEGGLMSRAVERPHGEGQQHGGQPGEGELDEESACLNCGTELIGTHCHSCGQKGHIHRSLAAIWHDIVHGVLHLDGKLWRTLPLLTFKPGELTRRYIDGERAKFVSPMAMFLFSVFLMFAVFQIIGLTPPATLDTSPEVQQSLNPANDALQVEIAQARKEVEALPKDSPQRIAVEKKLKNLEGTSEILDISLDEGDSSNMTFNDMGIAALDKGIVKKWNENPGLMLYKLQNNSYKFSWLLIPLSIPFVWAMFFWKRRFKAYDHAIFVTYSLGFMSLLFIVLSLAGAAGIPAGPLMIAGFIIPVVHIYKQLRYTYGLSRFGALWRTLILSTIVIFIILAIFLSLLIMIGAL